MFVLLALRFCDGLWSEGHHGTNLQGFICNSQNFGLFCNFAAVIVLQKAKYRASKFSTIMLTNLPEGNYSHKEVVKLVWHYFSVQNLQTLFYKVLVLPLQRRV